MNPHLIDGVGSPQSALVSSAVQNHELGTLGFLRDMEFVYTHASTGAILPRGRLCQTGPAVANHTDLAVAAGGGDAGTNVVRNITLGATAVTANQYQDGELLVIDGAGEGQTFRIRSHGAFDAAATTFSAELFDEIALSLSASSRVSLVLNDFESAVVGAVNQLGSIIGAPRASILAGEYGWVQRTGSCLLLADEAITIGQKLTVGSSVTGSVEVIDLLAEETVAVALEAITNTEYGRCRLTLN